MNLEHPLQVGTVVEFDIVGDVGTAVVLEAEYDDGWAYRLDVTSGGRADKHRESSGELWASDFELRLPTGGLP